MRAAHTLAAIVEAGWAPSERYLAVRPRRGEIGGRKVGREWKLTAAHRDADIELLGNENQPVTVAVVERATTEPAPLRPTAASMTTRPSALRSAKTFAPSRARWVSQQVNPTIRRNQLKKLAFGPCPWRP